jgi:hypothetical protein
MGARRPAGNPRVRSIGRRWRRWLRGATDRHGARGSAGHRVGDRRRWLALDPPGAADDRPPSERGVGPSVARLLHPQPPVRRVDLRAGDAALRVVAADCDGGADARLLPGGDRATHPAAVSRRRQRLVLLHAQLGHAGGLRAQSPEHAVAPDPIAPQGRRHQPGDRQARRADHGTNVASRRAAPVSGGGGRRRAPGRDAHGARAAGPDRRIGRSRRRVLRLGHGPRGRRVQAGGHPRPVLPTSPGPDARWQPPAAAHRVRVTDRSGSSRRGLAGLVARPRAALRVADRPRPPVMPRWSKRGAPRRRPRSPRWLPRRDGFAPSDGSSPMLSTSSRCARSRWPS